MTHRTIESVRIIPANNINDSDELFKFKIVPVLRELQARGVKSCLLTRDGRKHGSDVSIFCEDENIYFQCTSFIELKDVENSILSLKPSTTEFSNLRLDYKDQEYIISWD